MSRAGFISEEDISWQKGTFKVLWRFLMSLHFVKRVFPVYFLSLSVAAVLPQFIVWAFGSYVSCSASQPCRFGTLELTMVSLALLVCASIAARIFTWSIYEVGGQWSCQYLHARMVRALSRVRTTYFDENPSGRMLNRLVGDFDAVRFSAIIRIGDTFYALLEVIANAILTVLVSFTVVFLIIPVVVAAFYIQCFVSPMMERCNRIKSVRRGVLIHRETDVIEGSRLYCLFAENGPLSERLCKSVRDFVQIHLLSGRLQAWGKFWLETVATLYEFVGIVFVIYSIKTGQISQMLAAVILTVLLRLRDNFTWFSWNAAQLIESLARVTRLFEIVDLPEQTLEERKGDVLQFAGRAKQQEGISAAILGDIKFNNFTMSYRPALPLIFDGLDLRVPFAKHTGIFGRTGSGKSSLVQSLYRMVYVHSGSVSIGEHSIYDLGVEQVREIFGMVPQDPYLFAGTLRSNLDRFGEYSDALLKQTLDTVGLQHSLDFPLVEGGKNLSQGERQLVCLARVLVSSKQYIIMDEPTSSIDSITDAKIQRILHGTLRDRTVITIAHRLETLNRHDWLIEMSNGKVVREGRPQELLKNIRQTLQSGGK